MLKSSFHIVLKANLQNNEKQEANLKSIAPSRMDVMSVRISSKAGLKREHCYQYAGEYPNDYKNTV